MKFNHKEFARFWNKAASVAEVQKKYKVSRVAASGRATYLRQRGHKLKMFKMGRKVR